MREMIEENDQRKWKKMIRELGRKGKEMKEK